MGTPVTAAVASLCFVTVVELHNHHVWLLPTSTTDFSCHEFYTDFNRRQEKKISKAG
jgi:hypothetical protein